MASPIGPPPWPFASAVILCYGVRARNSASFVLQGSHKFLAFSESPGHRSQMSLTVLSHSALARASGSVALCQTACQGVGSPSPISEDLPRVPRTTFKFIFAVPR